MIGKRFARFEIVERLGLGGMGVVYRARDLQLERDVAVKFLPARFAADADRLARFKREARAASALSHPNIVTIHEVGVDEGLPYMVMELVPGRPLRERLCERALPTRELLELGTQLAEGLARAHAAGIVHRDLKPENVMVTPEGLVKILDFGLAKAAASGADVSLDGATHSLRFQTPVGEQLAAASTDPGVVLGTAGYMSPEQAAGRPLDYRSDQFALGLLLYEMGTGRRAFERATAVQTMASILEDEPVAAGTLNPALPAPLRWVIARCLAKDPRQRYDSTQDLARELKTLRDHLGETSGSQLTPLATQRAAPLAARGRERWWGLLAAAVALVVLAGALREPLLRALGRESLPDDRHVVVLPFDSDAQDAAGIALSEGLADTLTSRLAGLASREGSLWVVPSADVRRAGVTTAGAARRAFGVTLAVVGRLQRTGSRLQLEAQLVDARQERTLRRISLSTPASEPTRIEDEALARLARLLDADAAPETTRARPAARVPASAYEAYLEGRGFLQRYEDPERLDRAISALQRAAEIDPSYALAYAGLGEAYWRRYEQTRRPDFVALAHKACRHALELNDLLAQVHVTLGLLHLGSGKATEAVAAFERALALDPHSADARLHLASALEAAGRLDQAEQAYRATLASRAGYWAPHNHLGAFLVARGRYPEAAAAFESARRLTPDNVRVLNNLGGVYQLMGRYGDAEQMLRESLRLRPSAAGFANLGTMLFMNGRTADAAGAFEQAVNLGPEDYRAWYNLAAARHWVAELRTGTAEACGRAVALGERQLLVNPHDGLLLAKLAECSAMLGQKQVTRARVALALREAAADPEVLYRGGLALEQIGERRRALELIGSAVRAGYSRTEIERSPGLRDLRSDPHFGKLPSLASATGAR